MHFRGNTIFHSLLILHICKRLSLESFRFGTIFAYDVAICKCNGFPFQESVREKLCWCDNNVLLQLAVSKARVTNRLATRVGGWNWPSGVGHSSHTYSSNFWGFNIILHFLFVYFQQRRSFPLSYALHKHIKEITYVIRYLPT